MGHTVVLCREREATSRGAALLALESLGAIRSVGDAAADLGAAVEPDGAKREIYDAALAKQRGLYKKIFEEKW
jgi:gluconokinase